MINVRKLKNVLNDQKIFDKIENIRSFSNIKKTDTLLLFYLKPLINASEAYF